jgi:hypothetical protein
MNPEPRRHLGELVCLLLIALGGFLMVFQLQRSIDAQTRVGDELEQSQVLRCFELGRSGELSDEAAFICADALTQVGR